MIHPPASKPQEHAARAPLLLRRQERLAEPPRLGQILVDMGEISPGDLIKAIAMRAREDILFGEILLANRMVSEEGLYRGLARQFGCQIADLTGEPPDTRLLRLIGPETCLQLGAMPWKRAGGVTVIATSRPERFAEHAALLGAQFGPLAMAVVSGSELVAALHRVARRDLAAHAETRVAAAESCRNWNRAAMARLIAGFVVLLAAGLIGAPRTTLLLLTGWAILALLLNTWLKAAAAWSVLSGPRPADIAFSSRRTPKQAPMLLPRISILVPLFREREVAGRLVRRLGRLNYPRELLDICLVLEEDDHLTRATLDHADLPGWMRLITVPPAPLKTKPRALNFALAHCRGSIVGVYDAEDAPEPDQLFQVARRFHETPREVACLQGVLDFYNPRQNWIARCFTIEYAAWFRLVLPGLERLGLVVPLGGTTVFFRREALEEIGGWDAHNVTEDADLGVRLARRGYRTEIIATTTEEEANCRPWAWVRQRSRWLKGYAITWAVHMRRPRRLWRDLGARRFFGMQLLFLGALSQFLLAPILWSFWSVPLGLHHPLQDVLSPVAFYLLTGAFVLCELVTMGVALAGLRKSRHRRLWPWVPTLHIYYPLAAIAAYKAIWEMIGRPFFWDKTRHGISPAQGAPGAPGTRGALGTQGTRRAPGTQATQGIQGTRGVQGMPAGIAADPARAGVSCPAGDRNAGRNPTGGATGAAKPVRMPEPPHPP